MLQAGDSLGDWVVERPLGEGGMGSVFLCHSQLSDEVHAAVKVLKSHGLGDFKRRFIDEMRTVASLKHPGIVGVRSGGEDAARELVYMAMEYIEGGDLEARMRRGPLSMDEAREIFVPIAQALAFAHGRGVHHRDLKPANIMLREEGPPVLVDFGIAVVQDRTRLTTEGMLPGTAAYMAPEVFRGANPELALGDIYALGVVLWEALSGQHAFWVDGELSDGQRLFQVVGLKVNSEALDPGPQFSDGVRMLVRQMTEPDPSLRLRDLAEVERVLLGRAVAPVLQETVWVPAGAAMVAEPPGSETVEACVEDQPVAAVGSVDASVVSAPVVSARRGRVGLGLAAAAVSAAALAVAGLGMAALAASWVVLSDPAPAAPAASIVAEASEPALVEPIPIEEPGLVVQREERALATRVVRAAPVQRRVEPAVVVLPEPEPEPEPEPQPEPEPEVVAEPEIAPEPAWGSAADDEVTPQLDSALTLRTEVETDTEAEVEVEPAWEAPAASKRERKRRRSRDTSIGVPSTSYGSYGY